MKSAKLFRISIFVILTIVVSGCGAAATSPTAAAVATPLQPTNPLAATAIPTSVPPTSTPAATAIPTSVPPTSTATLSGPKARVCDYIPGTSVPAKMPPEVLTPQAPESTPTPAVIPTYEMDKFIKNNMLSILRTIRDNVANSYIYPDLNGKDWQGIVKKYEDMVYNGLDLEAFNIAMKQMLFEFDGGITRFMDSNEVANQNNNGNGFYVGVGIRYDTLKVGGQEKVVVIGLHPGDPAERAGVKPHDVILKVDGGSFFDSNGESRVLGKEGTSVTLTIQTPGQAPRDVTLVRKPITSTIPVDFCLVSGTHIGYIRWVDDNDPQFYPQVVNAIKKLAESAPLQGLIIDTRFVGISNPDKYASIFGLFTKGNLGSWSGRGNSTPIKVDLSLDISGSQSVPLVLLQGGIDSFVDQFFNGLLQSSGRARIVGVPNTAPSYSYKVTALLDGAHLLVPAAEIQPEGKAAGYFNKSGVIPDVIAPARWDLFTEATDPQLASAVDLLSGK